MNVGGNDSAEDEARCSAPTAGCVVDWVGRFDTPGEVNGTGPLARFNGVTGITSHAGFLYVSDNYTIRRVDLGTAEVRTWAGTPGDRGAINARGTGARFGQVNGIATDGTYLWVADDGNSVIRRVEIESAEVDTLCGQVGVPGRDDGSADEAAFYGLRGLVFDGRFLYLSEALNHAVRRIDPLTGDVVTVAGGSSIGLSDGTGREVEFNSPSFLVAVGQNELFIADTSNHRIRHAQRASNLGPELIVTSPYGGSGGFKDGFGKATQFDNPRGIAFDGERLIVADSDNSVLRSIDLETTAVSTIAGEAGEARHQVDIGLDARFNRPMVVHYEPESQDLFISEGTVIRRMYHR
jgi:hypothetical protein